MLLNAIAQIDHNRQVLTSGNFKSVLVKAKHYAQSNCVSVLIRDSAGMFGIVAIDGTYQAIETHDFYWKSENIVITAPNIQAAWQIASNRINEARTVKTSEIVPLSSVKKAAIKRHHYSLSYL